ncbi:MAG: hypothetical protein EBS29_04785 [Chloroflexia bacterium]|nr:hypothetical protein [Chloroflexia bacterium]
MFQWLKERFAAQPPVAQPPEPVVVMICEGPVDASLYLAQLTDAGIPAALIGADSASMFGMQSGILADVRIVVPHEYADAAIDLLADSINNDHRFDDPSDIPDTSNVDGTTDIDDPTDV